MTNGIIKENGLQHCHTLGIHIFPHIRTINVLQARARQPRCDVGWQAALQSHIQSLKNGWKCRDLHLRCLQQSFCIDIGRGTLEPAKAAGAAGG